MFTQPRADTSEPLTLFLLRGLVYAAAVLLFVFPVSTSAGVIAALVAVPAGLLLGRRLGESKLRLPVLLLLGPGLLLSALWGSAWLGASAWLAGQLGAGTTVALLDGLTFGLGTFAVLLTLRSLSVRVPALVLLEAAAVAGVVVLTFVGHRNYQIDQPRFLSDWALMRGYDPLVLLLGVGALTLGALAILLFQKQRLARTLTTLIALLLLGVGGYWLLGGAAAQTQQAAQEQGGASEADSDGQGEQGEGGGSGRSSAPKPPIPIAQVLLHDDYDPAEEMYYFRTGAKSQFNGTVLGKATRAGADDDLADGLPGRRTEIDAREARYQRLRAALTAVGTGLRLVRPGPALGGPVIVPLPVEPDRMRRGRFRTVQTTIGIMIDEPYPLSLLSAVEIEPRSNPDPKRFRAVYRVTSRVITKAVHHGLRFVPAGDRAWSDELRQHYLAAPTDPRYKQLADEIAGRLSPAQRESAFLRVLAVKKWIEENTKYTKRPQPGDREPDPTAAYLFGARKGKCTHIANAMALLLRAQGVPTRVALGYGVPAERRGQRASFFVADIDGHAWCEVYFQDIGWVAIDPSPESLDPREGEPPAPPSDDALRNAQEVPEAGVLRTEATSGMPGLMSLALAGMAALSGLYLAKGWRRLAPRFAAAGQQYRVCYRAVLDLFADLGLRREYGETREEFAARMEGLAPEFVALSAAHVQAAVAGEQAHAAAWWHEMKCRITAAVRKHYPVGRRTLGALNPIAWLWVR